MLNFGRSRTQPRSNRSLSLGGMDYSDPKKKNNVVGKFILAATLTALCIIMLKQSPAFSAPSQFGVREPGVTHVLVTGGAGYIGSHATLRLLKDNYRVTIVDNLSRGNLGAVRVLQELFPEPGRLQFIYADLGDPKAVNKIFSENAFDAVMHFAAVAYVGESTVDPLKILELKFKLSLPHEATTLSPKDYRLKNNAFEYYHNITSNTLTLIEAMAAHRVKKLIYSSTCATYGEPDKMPITEETPQEMAISVVELTELYGYMAAGSHQSLWESQEDGRRYHKRFFQKLKNGCHDLALFLSTLESLILKDWGVISNVSDKNTLKISSSAWKRTTVLYFNVIGSDPEGRLGEAPRPELREQGRISGACFDAARGIIPGLKVRGTDYATDDGTCVRDYIDVTDLVDAHVKALAKAKAGKVGIYNVGTGKGRSVKEFVEACKKATGVTIKVDYLDRRPGDYAKVFSDPTKINKELNWTAQYTDLEKSLKVAWRWQKSHLNGYENS
ncbi:hypothetical protein Csa_003058 [Cucumis sativus]|nr:hypothetical protein Csa_003058 [Cucumis sativus]